MALGTAPHRVAPGIWATRDGRRLTPAGSAWWEHHHQQGLVTTDGHTTPRAQAIGFGKAISPTRPLLPAPPPPRHPVGQPTITPGQWAHTTPKQKMATEVTVPYKGKKYNVPIGFGGASAIDLQMAARAKAEALARARAAPPKIQFGKQATRAQRLAAAQYAEAHQNTLGGPIEKTITALGKGAIHGIEQKALDFTSLATGLAQGAHPTGADYEAKQRAATAIPSATKTIGDYTIGPSLTSLLQGGHAGGLGVGLDAALLPIPWLKGTRAAIRLGRGLETAGRAVDVASIPERTLRIEELKRAGFSEDQINAVIPFYDNQAAHHPGGPAEWWKERIDQPTGMSATEHAASPAGRVLHQETPEAARLKAKTRAVDAQRPTNAYWRDKHGIPHTATKKDFVEAQSIPIPGVREPHVPDIFFPPEETRANLIAKLFPQKGTTDGIPKTRDIWARAKGGEEFKLAGNISKHDWVQRVLAVVKDPKLIDELARWYEGLPRTFKQAFGDDADAMTRALSVSQANASPASGLTASMKVRDRLVAGDPLTKNDYSVVGLNIQQAFRDGKIESGVAAKLSDFVDSLAGRDTRTWMGYDPRGGSPSAVDVHAVRDRGFVDPRLQARLEGAGFKHGKDFILEGDGTASGAKYERISEWYDQISEHLNEIGFNGRKDWTPRQAQALGWSAIQMAHGVVPEGALEALARNSRTIGFEVTKGVGELGADLSPAETRAVAKNMLPHARALAEDIPGLWVRDARVAQGGWGSGSNIMIEVKVLGSENAIQGALTDFAQAFDQGGVQAAREVTRDTARAAVVIHSPAFKNPRTVSKFWRILHELSPIDERRTIAGPGKTRIPNPSHGEPLLQGYMPWDEEGVPAIAIRTDTRYLSPKTQKKFLDKFEEAIVKAGDEAGIDAGYTARNIELLTGDQSGATNPLQTLPSGWDTRGRATALAHPRSGGIRADLESTIERVRSGEPPGGVTPGGDPGELAPRTLHQRPAEPASALPKGATEFLAGGKTRVHFFEGADVSTLMHELLHVSVHDLRGRHLLTLADEFAGGKPLAQWTDAEHEAVAQSFEQWLRTGEITNPKLKSPFAAIKEWMLALVGKAKGVGMVVPKDVEDAFNHMFRAPEVPLEQQVVGAARKAPEEFAAQDLRRGVERSRRAGLMVQANEEGAGMEAHYAGREALRGELPRDYVTHLTHLTEDDLNYLRDVLWENTKLRPHEKGRVMDGIVAASKGEIMPPAVARDVLKAWAPKGTKGAARMTLSERAVDLLIQIVNIPRSFMSTLDASGFLRQGLVASALHPVTAAKLVGPMLKYGWSEKYYAQRMARYAKEDDFHTLVGAGMEMTDINHTLASEEAYQSHLAETITLGKHGPVRRSGRMYTGFLNDMRYATGKHMLDVARRQTAFDEVLTRLGHPRSAAVLGPKELKDIAKVANWSTGRGHLGKHEQALSLLNLIFFSPRLLKSRLDTFNPFFYGRMTPVARRTAVRAAVQLVVGGTAILEMAHLAGLDVGINPTSSDFGKIKVGNTRIDLWGGHQSVAAAIMKTVKRQSTSATTGVTSHVNPFQPGFRYFQGKLAPIPSLEEAYRTGKEFVGTPFNWKEASYSRLTPFIIQDAYSAYHDTQDPSFTALIASLSAIGLGANTFKPKAGGSSGSGDYNPPTASGGGDYNPPSSSGSGDYP